MQRTARDLIVDDLAAEVDPQSDAPEVLTFFDVGRLVCDVSR